MFSNWKFASLLTHDSTAQSLCFVLCFKVHHTSFNHVTFFFPPVASRMLFNHRRLINNLHSVSVVWVFCCLFFATDSLAPRAGRGLQSGLKASSVPIVLPLGSPRPAVLMRDALPTQTEPVNYSLPESVMNCYLLLRSGVQMVSGASRPASRDAAVFWFVFFFICPSFPTPAHGPSPAFNFNLFHFFGRGGLDLMPPGKT